MAGKLFRVVPRLVNGVQPLSKRLSINYDIPGEKVFAVYVHEVKVEKSKHRRGGGGKEAMRPQLSKTGQWIQAAKLRKTQRYLGDGDDDYDEDNEEFEFNASLTDTVLLPRGMGVVEMKDGLVFFSPSEPVSEA